MQYAVEVTVIHSFMVEADSEDEAHANAGRRMVGYLPHIVSGPNQRVAFILHTKVTANGPDPVEPYRMAAAGRSQPQEKEKGRLESRPFTQQRSELQAESNTPVALAELQEHFNRVRKDALPEDTDYQDNGCDLHPSCLTCPLAVCRYDLPTGFHGDLAGLKKTARTLRRQGCTPTEISQRMGVSRRSVFRYLAA